MDALTDLRSHDFDTIIDVRSPSEYFEDHIPGAINLPVLDDEERARVGTIYKQESPFRARKIGAALVFRNAAHHIETALGDYDGRWKPLVYCWRGGQRSGSFAWMLREIGWRAETIEGGYRSYRRLVVKELYEEPLRFRLVQLGGYTGTAKTELLPRLESLGVQVLDLEGLARHRGSILGDLGTPQPSQKSFESALAGTLARLDPGRLVLVEAESSKIGAVTLPPSIWSAMQKAPWIVVSAPLEARARYLADAYADVLADGDVLKSKLAPLRRYRGHAVVDNWNSLADAGDQVALCRSLAADHYDPSYDKSARSRGKRPAARVHTQELSPAALDAVAEQIAAELQTIST
ncbi:tRNA 2-selenouridine(34) synthase MnmH [Marimonas arenosa]|uniref:tRNA 2-selenouridine(34) synthase MnmH n=1 Tax=Marimonas arenosa TaxID=1795305 RepID=A0AAE4B5X4_9RHOB|nr:tRNA 2-selenouridine(34) synthase MnmH [Marimonas arenosa]MDQ2091790.1 tRNA 2-selenouridine(34) synthase MnmH [Marimonas arenosa]